jgi:hypothetical protein
VVTAQFSAEKDLEDFIEVQVSLLSSLIGQDLLIIGRQVTVVRRRIDLLAIDGTGAIYIIELKLDEATPATISQVLDYRRRIKLLNRDEIIRTVAEGARKLDLDDAFQRHFGRPLPQTVNGSQVLMIIAASIPRRTASAILELKDLGCSIATFRYVAASGAINLIPCCRDEQDVESSYVKTRPPISRERSTAGRSHRSPIYRVQIEETTRRFWLLHTQNLTSTFVTFRSVYDAYEKWVHTQTAEGPQLPLRSGGLFARQLHRIVAESGEWTHVFLPPETNMVDLEKLTDPPSARTRRDADHRISAYQRNAIGPALPSNRAFSKTGE